MDHERALLKALENAAPGAARPHSKAILAVSPFLWPLGEDKGVRVVFETVRGYVRSGYEAHLVTLSNSEETETLNRGLHVHFVRLPFVPAGIRYNLFRSVFSYPLSASRSRSLGYLWDKLLWAQFVVVGNRRALEVGRRVRPELVYGFTSYGVPVAWAVGRRLSIPLSKVPLVNWVLRRTVLVTDPHVRDDRRLWEINFDFYGKQRYQHYQLREEVEALLREPDNHLTDIQPTILGAYVATVSLAKEKQQERKQQAVGV